MDQSMHYIVLHNHVYMKIHNYITLQYKDDENEY